MLLTFLLIGLAAGILSGLFGIGGGILIVPSLVLFAKLPIKTATGTSLGALLLPVGLLGALAYYKAGHVDVRAAALIVPGLFFGAYGGAKLNGMVSASVVQRLFAVFLVIVAVRMWAKA
jgi:uncharacterized membrane protein YfcA